MRATLREQSNSHSKRKRSAMHTYDRDGSKHRSAEDGKLLFGVGYLCCVVFILAGLSALADMLGW